MESKSKTLILLLTYLHATYSQEFMKEKPTYHEIAEWSKQLSSVLINKANTYSGYDTLLKQYKDGSGIQMVPVDGEKLLNKMNSDLLIILDKKLGALKKLVKTAETLVKNYRYDGDLRKKNSVKWVDTKNFIQDDKRLTYNESFQQPVNFQYSSVHVPVEVYSGHPVVQNGLKWSVDLNKIFKENREKDPTLLWQYFGSQVGYMRTYPAMRWNNNPEIPDLFDVRRRSWYIHGSSSPKDMLILIDISGSVHGQTLEIIRVAVKTLLNTLGENDFVNIASFNQTASWISCFDTLVQADKWNKKILSQAVTRISDSGIANFDVGLEFAFKQFHKFDQLKKRHEGAECHKLIMLFTDGGMQKPNRTLLKYNKDKQIRIFTYSVSAHAIPFSGVKWIACQSKGAFSNIIGIGAVHESIQEYVEVLSRPQALAREETYRWSNFYYDAMGLGMLTTVTHPVYNNSADSDNQTLVGVMGVDASITEMIDLTPLKTIGPLGYSLCINRNGFIVFHPLLKPEYEYLEEPPDVDFLDLEDSSEDKEKLRMNMIDRLSGTITLQSSVKISKNYHVATAAMKYHYMPVGETTFRLALVIPESRTHFIKIKDYGKPDFSSAAVDSSTFISPKFLCDSYLNYDTISETLIALSEELTSLKGNCQSEIISHIFWDLKNTESLMKFWKTINFNNSQVVGNIVGTEGGVIRYFPESLEDKLTFEKNIWQSDFFKRAYLSDADTWTFSFSLYDRTPDTVAITSSRPLRVEYSGIPYIPAVIGVKLNANLLYEKLMSFTSKYGFTCSDIDSVHCYVLDDGGVVMATNENDWIQKVGLHIESLNLRLYHLLDNHTYIREPDYDYQAKCFYSEEELAGSASTLSNILTHIISLLDFRWILSMSWYQFNALFFSLFSMSWLPGGNAEALRAIEVEPELFQRCITKSARYHYRTFEPYISDDHEVYANCSRWLMVSKIEETNLIFVMTDMPCTVPPPDDEILEVFHEPREDPKDPDFCQRKLQYRMRPKHCFHHDDREVSKCKSSYTKVQISMLMISLLILKFI